MPEGLKVYAPEIIKDLREATSSSFVLLADPCYGACDFPVNFRDMADALIQFGHSPIPSLSREDTLFVEVYSRADPLPLVEEALPLIDKRVGLLTTVQHIPFMEDLRRKLEAEGVQVLIGRGDDRIRHPGQVLGCNITAALAVAEEVDQFLYVGSGNFHPLAVAIGTNSPVLILDPIGGEVRTVDRLKERILRQRHAAITLASQAERFAVLGSFKPGQFRGELMRELEALLSGADRQFVSILMNDFHPDHLQSFDVDAYVSTACPRLAIDDYLRYRRPMLTPPELEISLGLRDWEDYSLDQMLG